MQVTSLLYPGRAPAQLIRRQVAAEISALEIADASGTPDPSFAAFLADAASKTPGYAGPTLPATQAVVSDAQALVIGAQTFTFTVAGGVITAIVVS